MVSVSLEFQNSFLSVRNFLSSIYLKGIKLSCKDILIFLGNLNTVVNFYMTLFHLLQIRNIVEFWNGLSLLNDSGDDEFIIYSSHQNRCGCFCPRSLGCNSVSTVHVDVAGLQYTQCSSVT